MGIQVVRALLLVGIVLFGNSTQAQTYKNQAQFRCGGVSSYRAENPSTQELKQLDQELSYANRELKNLLTWVGTWVYESPDEDNKISVNTIELALIGGVLKSRLINWGSKGFSTSFSDVEINAQEALLKLEYNGYGQKILLRPISRTKMRYAYSDSCAINFADEYSPVFKRK